MPPSAFCLTIANLLNGQSQSPVIWFKEKIYEVALYFALALEQQQLNYVQIIIQTKYNEDQRRAQTPVCSQLGTPRDCYEHSWEYLVLRRLSPGRM
jgi:hypothetical protein